MCFLVILDLIPLKMLAPLASILACSTALNISFDVSFSTIKFLLHYIAKGGLFRTKIKKPERKPLLT